MGLWQKITGGRSRERLVPLYRAIVTEARRREWYTQADVPDTIDGRFDLLALILALVLIRLEREGGHDEAALLTEVFIDDMDGTMREAGFGDLVVGKQVGGIMGALGGRLSAYREPDRARALLRNLYRGRDPGDRAMGTALAMTGAVEASLSTIPLDQLLGGRLT